MDEQKPLTVPQMIERVKLWHRMNADYEDYGSKHAMESIIAAILAAERMHDEVVMKLLCPHKHSEHWGPIRAYQESTGEWNDE